MSPISGQFHAYSTKCTSKRLAGLDFLAWFERRGDVEDQAHPPSAMVDDDHGIVASKRA